MGLEGVKLISKRLKQVPMSLEYAEDVFNNFTEEITTYMYPKAADNIEETKSFIENAIKGLNNGSNLQLVILDKYTGEFLGCSGIHRIDTKTPELGLWLKKSAHGNGYGMEAIGAIIKWAKENVDLEYIMYPVDRRNFPSRRIPEVYGGIIKKEYKETNLSGDELDIVEYWIYK